MLLPKSSVGGESGQVEVCVDGEVELSEQRLAIEGLCENTAASAPLRGVLSHNSCAIQKASGLGRDTLRPTAAAVHLKGEESPVVGGACGNVGIVTDNGSEPPIRTDGTHLVAVIPHQVNTNEMNADEMKKSSGSIVCSVDVLVGCGEK